MPGSAERAPAGRLSLIITFSTYCSNGPEYTAEVFGAGSPGGAAYLAYNRSCH